MKVKTIDTRNVPDSTKVSRDPQKEPKETDLEHHYTCDTPECGKYLVYSRDKVYYYKPAGMHLCEDCMRECIEINKEYGISEEKTWEETEEL
jgi:hypothetical protein